MGDCEHNKGNEIKLSYGLLPDNIAPVIPGIGGYKGLYTGQENFNKLLPTPSSNYVGKKPLEQILGNKDIASSYKVGGDYNPSTQLVSLGNLANSYSGSNMDKKNTYLPLQMVQGTYS